MALAAVPVVALTQAKIQVRAAVVERIVVAVAKVRMVVEAVVVPVQPPGAPTDAECGGDAPKQVVMEVVAPMVGVVVHRIGSGVVAVNPVGLPHDHLRRLVVGHMDSGRAGGLNANGALFDRHFLLAVAFQVAGQPRLFAEGADRGDEVLLLGQHRLAQPPSPVQVPVQQLQRLRVVQQGHHRLVPALVRLGLPALVLPLQEPGRLHHLQGIGGGRQHDGQQVVGVERHRRHQGFQLLGA